LPHCSLILKTVISLFNTTAYVFKLYKQAITHAKVIASRS